MKVYVHPDILLMKYTLLKRERERERERENDYYFLCSITANNKRNYKD